MEMLFNTFASIIWTCFFIGASFVVFIAAVDIKNNAGKIGYSITEPGIFIIIFSGLAYMVFPLMMVSWGVW